MTQNREREQVIQPRGCKIRVVVRELGDRYVADFYDHGGMFMFDIVPNGEVDWDEFLQYCEFLALDYDDK